MRASSKILRLSGVLIAMCTAAQAEPGGSRMSSQGIPGFRLTLPDLPIEDRARNADWPRILTVAEIERAHEVRPPDAKVLGPLLVSRSEDLRNRAIGVEATPQRSIIENRINALRQKARALAANGAIDQDDASQ